MTPTESPGSPDERSIRDDQELVRRGTSRWHELVASLDEADLDAPTLLQGWTRRHLIAHVAFNARALGRLADWARTGVENPMYASQAARDEEIAQGAELSGRQLRRLDHATSEALAEDWASLPDDRWSAEIRTRQGNMVPLRSTLWMRSREVWIHAVDLDAGLSFAELPEEFLERLFDDVVGSLSTRDPERGYAVAVDERTDLETSTTGGPDHVEIRGPLWAVVAWASGRGGDGLSAGADQPAPTWL